MTGGPHIVENPKTTWALQAMSGGSWAIQIRDAVESVRGSRFEDFRSWRRNQPFFEVHEDENGTEHVVAKAIFKKTQFKVQRC